MITLFHVTRGSNLFSISEKGVDNNKSAGKLAVSWWVDRDQVVWAMAHVSARWGTPVDKLIVIEHKFEEDEAIRWMVRGLFMVKHVVKAEIFWGYEQFLKPEI